MHSSESCNCCVSLRALHTNNWFGQGINSSTNQQINAKADHNFTEKARLSSRYSQVRSQGTNPNLFGDNNPAYWTGGPNRTLTHSVVGDYNHVLSANTLFNVRYGWTYSDFARNLSPGMAST
jgi:hypothetical protein